MRLATVLISSCAAFALSACGGSPDTVEEQPAVAAVSAPDDGNWSQTVTETADGGFVVGNPEAPIKLIEYGSLTCGHCATFANDSKDELYSDFIDSGKVAFEFRNYLINRQADALAGAIIRCTGKDRYYPMMKNLYANQAELYDKIGRMTEMPDLSGLSDDQKYGALARAMGLYDFFTARGVSEGEIDQCMADTGNVQAIVDGSQKATEDFGISRTPSFLINGTLVKDGNTWSVIKEYLQTAGAR